MVAMRVTTWNVLHRVHAINWKEGTIEAFPDERVRISGIAAKVAGWLAIPDAIVCLQEVSGDLLASLRRAMPDLEIHSHAYPRIPRVRVGSEFPLDDPTEHLVTIARMPAVRGTSQTFESDPGKGLLVVQAGGVRVINTHVSFGPRRREQLALLGALAREESARSVIAGDFNATDDLVREGIGGPLVMSDQVECPTRIPSSEDPPRASHHPRAIDHVVVLGGTIVSAAVLDREGLSDHQPVSADVRFDV